MQIINQISYLDSVLKQYGDVSYIFHYANLNGLNNIIGIFSAGTEVVVDNFKITEPVVNVQLAQEPITKTIFVDGMANQNIFDISTRYFGNLTKIFELAQANGLSITDSVSNKKITINNFNKKADIVNYFEKLNKVFSTNIEIKKSFNKSWNISFH